MQTSFHPASIQYSVISISEYFFASQPYLSCSGSDLGYLYSDSFGYHDNCKKWYVARDDCGGFSLVFGQCKFKDTVCKNNAIVSIQATLFLKTLH